MPRANTQKKSVRYLPYIRSDIVGGCHATPKPTSTDLKLYYASLQSIETSLIVKRFVKLVLPAELLDKISQYITELGDWLAFNRAFNFSRSWTAFPVRNQISQRDAKSLFHGFMFRVDIRPPPVDLRILKNIPNKQLFFRCLTSFTMNALEGWPLEDLDAWYKFLFVRLTIYINPNDLKQHGFELESLSSDSLLSSRQKLVALCETAFDELENKL